MSPHHTWKLEWVTRLLFKYPVDIHSVHHTEIHLLYNLLCSLSLFHLEDFQGSGPRPITLSRTFDSFATIVFSMGMNSPNLILTH